MSLILSKCTTDQLGELAEISRSTFRDAFAHLNDPADFEAYMQKSFSDEAISKELGNPLSEFYLVYYHNRLAAYFKINKAGAQTDLQQPDSLELERIYVQKDFQGKRIGRWILDQLIEMAREKGFSTIWLGVWEENRDAIRFYELYGFKKFDQHPYYIGEDRQTDWLMRLDITTL